MPFKFGKGTVAECQNCHKPIDKDEMRLRYQNKWGHTTFYVSKSVCIPCLITEQAKSECLKFYRVYITTNETSGISEAMTQFFGTIGEALVYATKLCDEELPRAEDDTWVCITDEMNTVLKSWTNGISPENKIEEVLP